MTRSLWTGAALAAALVLGACADPAEEDTAAEETVSAEQGTGSEHGAASEEDDGVFTIFSAGDVIPHDNVLDSAELDGGGYDFHALMSGVEEWVSGSDLALCSLEAPLAPDGAEPSGYPVFGAPDELVTDLQNLGFHGCSTANNHAMDRGFDGLQHTLEVMDAHGMGHVGTARSEQEAAEPQRYTLERGGREVVVAHVATTMLHNEVHPIPADQPWSVTDLEADELTEMAAQAREDGADLVVASVHWGQEYVHQPGPEQTEYADQLASGGQVDVVFGSHSHTPQPVELLDGGPHDGGMWIAWSMGNFLSNQDEQCCVMESATGAMVVAEVDASDGQQPRVTGLQWAPVTVDRGPTDDHGHRGIWPLDDLRQDGIPEELDIGQETVEERYGGVLDVMGEEFHRTEAPEMSDSTVVIEPREHSIERSPAAGSR